jgi:hypothetical protein
MKEELIAELNNFRTERLIRSKQISNSIKHPNCLVSCYNFFSGQSENS